jgi:tetratricopeptide (TPR) repeat protein
LAEVDPPNAPLCLVQRFDCLMALGDHGGALSCADEVIKAAPTNPAGYYCKGTILLRTRRFEEAVEAYRQTAKLGPSNPEAHFALGGALHTTGRHAEAAEAFREAQEKSPRANPRRQFYEKQQRFCERAARLQPRLPELLRSTELPADWEDLLALADLCQRGEKRYYAAAVKFYKAAIAARPETAEEIMTGHRQLAAAASVQAGLGKGEDAADLDEGERERLRRQGLDWLKAELVEWKKVFDRTPPMARHTIRLGLEQLHTNPEFACTREPAVLEQLTPGERDGWKEFWNEVEGLMKQVDGAGR